MENVYIYLIIAGIGAFTSLGAAFFAVRSDSKIQHKPKSDPASVIKGIDENPITRGAGEIKVSKSFSTL